MEGTSGKGEESEEKERGDKGRESLWGKNAYRSLAVFMAIWVARRRDGRMAGCYGWK